MIASPAIICGGSIVQAAAMDYNLALLCERRGGTAQGRDDDDNSNL
jgi:hypothetical protein